MKGHYDLLFLYALLKPVNYHIYTVNATNKFTEIKKDIGE